MSMAKGHEQKTLNQSMFRFFLSCKVVCVCGGCALRCQVSFGV